MLDILQCKAIIQSGPRRGQECGRTCYGIPYCTQYHRKGYERKQERQRNRETIYGTVAAIPQRQVYRPETYNRCREEADNRPTG
jgi:hypothetical protein